MKSYKRLYEEKYNEEYSLSLTWGDVDDFLGAHFRAENYATEEVAKTYSDDVYEAAYSSAYQQSGFCSEEAAEYAASAAIHASTLAYSEALKWVKGEPKVEPKKEVEYINLTPHEVKLNTGETYPTSGTVARVSTSFIEIEEKKFRQKYGEIENLSEPQENTLYIVSAIVFAATDRKDVIAPATGHVSTVRNENGQIVSVPGFIIK